MIIPPEKKSTFYIITLLVLLVGVILGAMLASYSFVQNKDALCLAIQPPKTSTANTANQVQKLPSLQQNTTIFGKVTATDASSFTLQIPVANLLNAKNATTTTLKIPFDATKDSVVVIKKTASKTGSTISTVAASFSDIKVGAQVLVKVVDGKKTVYIPPSP